ncbi:hypothetical protein KPL35_10885 [Clostridium sp. CF011]|uniref:hypothetical protein n=1 Tax=Clostridium sp. CF011 TaxID=2843318 RepID=UPI001C0DDBF4|nr:hypothetical protein [Clostridium sp. CF011]MBU3092578.1 hypothetical protein [Clostridium sp. CF011]WAG68707.1 hypothetical protein LL036_11430 [Clostridium sp. CF011]
MVFDTNIAMALKNPNGEYKVCELTIFEIENMETVFPSLKVELHKGTEILIKVKCSLCEEFHFYHYNINEFFKINMVIGGCEQLALPIFLIGKNQKVIEKVNEYRQTIEKIYAMI